MRTRCHVSRRRGEAIARQAGVRCQVFTTAALFFCLAVTAFATPLDDKIDEFKNADTQTEAAAAALLKLGIDEGRAAKALVAVKPWLSANTPRSQALLFYAGRAMHYSGDWSDAVIFYRRLLKSKSIDPRLAGMVVPATYRMMINDMRDSEATYLFMREDGNRLRQYGRAKQFDHWFLEKALEKNDLRAMADRLASIYSNPAEDTSVYDGYMDKLEDALESFAKRDESTVEALDKLAVATAAKHPKFRARWDWINAVSHYNEEALKVSIKRQEPAKELLTEPLKAARALITLDPVAGSAFVVKGWSRWNQGDTPTFFRFVHSNRDLKAQPFIEALSRLSPEDAKRLLSAGAQGPRGRWVSVAGFISPQKALLLIPRFPAVFNALDAPAADLWNKAMTVEQAKTLAPHLTRNPHGDAALIRGVASAGDKNGIAVLAAMAKTEGWRFYSEKRSSGARQMVDMLWRSGLDCKGIHHENEVKKIEKQWYVGRYDQLKKQIAATADSKNRMAAFNTIYQELRGTPSTPSLMGLWNELLTQSHDKDREKILKTLTADFVSATGPAKDLQKYLLGRAIDEMNFGNPYSRFSFGPSYRGGWDRWGYGNMRKKLPELADYLGKLLRQQMQAGTISKSVFAMWLHCVEPKKGDAKALMKELAKSPAYAKLGKAYHRMAAHQLLFGDMAITERSPDDPSVVSRELLDLPKEATPLQVETALKAVMTRVSQAYRPVKVIGIHKVAALSKLEGPTLTLALALFDGLSPLGSYPQGQGYEQLATRLIKEMRDSGKWGDIVPYAASLWRTCYTPDDARNPRVADALVGFAEAALEAGNASVALSVARSGLRSGTDAVSPNGRYNPTASQERRGRLNAVAGKAAVAMGVVEIKADQTDPAYGIYKSASEFVKGNLDSAWKLYTDNSSKLFPETKEVAPEGKPLLRKLPVEYLFWLMRRDVEQGRREDAEELVKGLTIWSREEEGLLSLEQDAELKITLADLAFIKGALPTARAWYRKVADAREYKGSDVHVRAALGSVKVDRVSKNFDAALEELEKLMAINNPVVRTKVRYAKAEVLMDQERYKDAFDELDAVLRSDPNHEDAKILRGKIEIKMRKLVEASEIELGVSREDKVMVPGEVLKINLYDPTLRISGVSADIEVEVWAKSGDRERVMLHQLGDNKEKFRADVPTALAPAVKGDKTLQVLGVDEIRYGYSQRFRTKMKNLPPDPTNVITIASDAQLSFSAGAFPPRKGERKLSIEELGLSTAQAKLGARMVRPGNPVYVRVIDPDESKTTGIDEIPVGIEVLSGDVIRRLMLKETGPYTGEFEGIIPTASAQASAFASEAAPGRDPNMAISSKDYPGWLGKVGDKNKLRTFGVDFNDNVPLDKMAIQWLGENQALTHFVLQTSLNGKDWVTRARYPKDEAPWDGRPRVSSIPTYRGGIPVSLPRRYQLPADWAEKMELGSSSASCGYLAAHVSGLSADKLPIVNTGHPGYSGLLQYRALFYQKDVNTRRFKLTGCPARDDKGNIKTIFLIDGETADEESDDPMMIERELKPGLHEIQVWRHDGGDKLQKAKPVLMCDVPGKQELQPCPDSMFDPKTFPQGVQAQIPQPASITNITDAIRIEFGDKTQARLVRLVISGYQGVAPGIKKVAVTGRDNKVYLPVKQDFMALRDNDQLEVLPGDNIIVRYEDEVSATPGREKHEARLGVAFNTAEISASFLNYETTTTGRRLLLEPIRRFNLEDAVAIVIDDVDMDSSPKRDIVDFMAVTSSGEKTKLKAVETSEHSGRFLGRIFPVTGKPQRESELQVPEGGSLTLIYRDMENLDPGIPTDRKVTIEHAKYVTPKMGAYTVSSEWFAPAERPKVTDAKPKQKQSRRASGPEVFYPRRTLGYDYVDEHKLASTPLKAVIGGSVRFDVVAPHLALAQSSTINAYVQVVRQAEGSAKPQSGQPFDVTLPGTLKLTAHPSSRGGGAIPRGYQLAGGSTPETKSSGLDEGRFAFSVPLILGDQPQRSFATESAELSGAEQPDGLTVKAGDVVLVGFAWKDENKKVQWKTATVKVGSHAFMDVMNAGYNEPLDRVFVGERVFLRVLAPGLDQTPERDWTSVKLNAASGPTATFKLRETLEHSGVFKGVFTVNYAADKLPEKLPPVELNGFPVKYGDEVVVTYPASGEDPEQKATVAVNMGSDGNIEPFSKRFTGDEMAVRTSFTLSECFFELAKKHKKMAEESLARREMAHAKKLLQEAIATHREDDLRANAEYLLGNLAQEYADLAQNDDTKLPMYQDALARFSKIPVDYPETEFADKAQFKTGLVYEKMGEGEIAVEEYVKLAYKYPKSEHIPEVMSRLGKYFQALGQKYKEQADPLREKEDVDSKGEVLRLDELSYPYFLKAATIYGKLLARFPDNKLAGLAGLASAQNYMRAHQYQAAIDGFKKVVDTEEYDDNNIRAQALYWSGLSYERISAMGLGGGSLLDAYHIYRRTTFDFPDSKWAKYARGRLADPAFAKIIEEEEKTRNALLDAIKYQRIKRSQDQGQKKLMDKLLKK